MLRNAHTKQHLWHVRSALVALLELHGHLQVKPMAVRSFEVCRLALHTDIINFL